MKIEIKNKVAGSLRLVLVSVMLIMLSNLALGYGVITEYTSDRQLQIEAGGIYETYIKILNTGEGEVENIAVDVEIVDNAGIASFSEQTRYNLAGGEIVEIPITVSIPDGASLGAEYEVKYKVTPIPPEEGEGTIGFGVGYEGSFGVEVVDQSSTSEIPEGGSTWWIWAIVVVIVLVIAWFLLKKKA